MSDTPRTGGCQCGAVRFRINGRLGRASICHCRMCQKQFGSFFSALVTVPPESLAKRRAVSSPRSTSTAASARAAARR
jgi:hypothetical protein